MQTKFLLLLVLFLPFKLLAEERICARVKIEIIQELAFERQAFDARMRIVNSLTTAPLENVEVELLFQNQDGSAATFTSNPNGTALFFLRQDSLRNIENTSGTGKVAPVSDAEIHWLIIPTRGAAGDGQSGKLYYIGARLKYSLNGEEQTVEVAPDFITVKPQPKIELDYFLKRDVYADDPFTDLIEPAEPFSLGVRVKNTGKGSAKNVTIDSAQPRIVENKEGLLIGFKILDSFVDNEPAAPTLLINFGEIKPTKARVGRWRMETTLAGSFESFTASFTHADELGGKLTSLLDRTGAHLLEGDVLVDLPGRDNVRDFLANDSGIFRVFESEGLDTIAYDQSEASALSAKTNGVYQLVAPRTAGFIYVKLPDPTRGALSVVDATRADGKILPKENVWFSSTDVGSKKQFFLNLFDTNGGGTYEVATTARLAGPQTPVLQYIPDRVRREGQRLTFLVEGTDQNGTIPALSLSSRPVGASFIDQGNGKGIFDWSIALGQAGKYPLTFFASDGELFSSRTAVVKVLPFVDSDNDKLDDAWELKYFKNLDQDGDGDPDRDKVLNSEEEKLGTDPTVAGNTPAEPLIVSPIKGGKIREVRPTLVIENIPHADQIPTYDFELFSDDQYTNKITSADSLVETSVRTSWLIDRTLPENSWYYWRVRAKMLLALGDWAEGSFFVEPKEVVATPTPTQTPIATPIASATPTPPPAPTLVVKNPPTVPALLKPGIGAWIENLKPVLEISKATDPDGDKVSYRYELYSDEGMTALVSTAISEFTEWNATSSLGKDLENGKWYYWRVRAEDATGLTSAWSETGRFFINRNKVNDPPSLALLEPASSLTMLQGETLKISWSDADSDSNALISLKLGETVIANNIAEDPDGADDLINWTVNVAPGVYKLTAEIRDEANTVKVESPHQITVAAPIVINDIDKDTIPDQADNCPYVSNTNQKDRGGLLTKRPDGIGDACQCGDITGDGRIDDKDLKLYTQTIAKKGKPKFKRTELCNISSSTACDKKDLSALTKVIASEKKEQKKKGRKPAVSRFVKGLQRCQVASKLGTK
jgi:hypothetical protein